MKNKSSKGLDKLSKQDLINLIITQHDSKIAYNKISVADFSIESYESLKVCEDTINRLIDRNKDFFTLRKARVQLEGPNIGIG